VTASRAADASISTDAGKAEAPKEKEAGAMTAGGDGAPTGDKAPSLSRDDPKV
jgi:hypothetical protein